jgi:serine/threonine-protein kinase
MSRNSDDESPPTTMPLAAESANRSPAEETATVDAARSRAGGQLSIGPYRIVKELGRGGMGSVHLAVRDDDSFRKRVALKVLRPGSASDEIVRRFRNERQILAAIEHPFIARLLDGGSTAEGLPYLVMEHVQGAAIDEYCDSRRAGLGERLALFRKVCAAVHFAHQNLVVHRDIKPANILVTDDGTPKLLDFGIAKLLNPELSSQTLDPTRMDERLMTPAYSSPEQLKGELITTASDVYALGVLLYELLTGHRPYRLHNQQLHEIARIICELEPTRPSVVVQQSEETIGPDGGTRRLTPEAVSRARDVGPERLRRDLRGDLDAIVMMAMRKEPRRRYSSAEQLAEDIGRYLERRPVRARRGTWAYRSARFVRRHRLALAAATGTAVLVAGFTLVTLRERQRAESEAAKARAVAGFLREMLASAGPLSGQGRETRVLDVLDRAEAKLAEAFAHQPEVRAEAEGTLGKTYSELGEYQKAERLLRSALETRRLLGPDQPAVAEIMNDLAVVLTDRGDHEGAEALTRAALEIARAAPRAQRDALVGRTLNVLAIVVKRQGKLAEAERLYREAIALERNSGAGREAQVAVALNNLGETLRSQGRLREAEPVLREALALHRRVKGEDHPDLAATLNNLMLVLSQLHRFEEAEQIARQVLEMDSKLLGEHHPFIAWDLSNLASALTDTSKLEEGEALARRSLAARRQADGGEHPNVVPALLVLGRLLLKADRLDESERLLAEAVRILEKARGRDQLDVASALGRLAEIALARGKLAEAAALWEEATNIMKRLGSPNRLLAARLKSEYGACLVRLARHAQAEAELTVSLPILEESLGERHPETR